MIEVRNILGFLMLLMGLFCFVSAKFVGAGAFFFAAALLIRVIKD